MEASISEAYNRVVNRRLYSKKIVLSVVFAFVMVASAFVIATSTRADNVTPSLEAWTLEPGEKWTKGDIKGYAEGFVIPVNLTLERGSSSDFVGVRLGFEWGKNPGGDEIRGFDKVVLYNYIDPITELAYDPESPYNNPVEDPEPFYAEPAALGLPKGLLSQAPALSNDVSGLYKDDNRYWIAWDLKFWFFGSFEEVKIFSGGLLFQTTETTKGASFYQGSSLHIRILDLIDEQGDPIHAGGGSQDLPINVMEILTPPSLAMDKRVDPDVRAEYETSTVILRIENDGQSDAYLLDLVDELPDELEYQAGSLKTYTSTLAPVSIAYNPIHGDPTSCDPVHEATDLHLEFSDPALACYAWLPGTAYYDNFIRYFSFEVIVKGDPWPDGWDFVEDGRLEITNYADLYFTDEYQDVFDPILDVPATMWIVKVAVDIEKEAWSSNDPSQGELIDCAARDYDVDGNGYIDPDSGDTIYYKMTVTNIGTEDIVSFKVKDDALKLIGFVWTWPADGQDGYSYPVPPLVPGESVYKYFEFDVSGRMDDVFTNEAWLKLALDSNGRDAEDKDSYSVDLLKPDVSITKVADRELAAWYDDPDSLDPDDGRGEVIEYTITVTNLDEETHVHFVVVDESMPYDDGMGGPQYYLTGSNAWTGTLEPAGDPDDTASLILYHTVTYRDPELIENTAYLLIDYDEVRDGTYAYCVDPDTGEPCWGIYPLTRSASETVDKVNPKIEITKVAVDDADPTNGDIPIEGVNPPGIVTYKITVDNTGDVGLWWFYWDSFSDPDWTPVPDGGPIWSNIGSGNYYIDGCWAVQAGEYSGEVPARGEGQDGVVALSIYDYDMGVTEFSYEVTMDMTDTPDPSHWRAGICLVDTDTGDYYLLHAYDNGARLYEYDATGDQLNKLWFVDGAPISASEHTLKVVYWTEGVASFFDVFIDGSLWMDDILDASPLSIERIGLAVWDEGSAVHVHFDAVLVKDLDVDHHELNVIMQDHFASLVPVDPTLPVPDIPFDPGVPPEFGCSQGCEYEGRLASGYMEPDDPVDERYYTYETQADDPQVLENTVTVYGWHNPGQPEWYTDDDATESVERYLVIWGYAFNDVHKTNSVPPWYGMYDGVRNKDLSGNYYLDEWGVNDPDGVVPGVVITLWDWDGTWDVSDPLHPFPIHKSNPRSQVTAYDSTYGDGYYKFSSLDPGDYVVDITITNPVSTDPSDMRYGSWFVTKYQWWALEDLVGGDEEQRDFGIARYGWIESYKWLDWNPNSVVDTGIGEDGLNGKEIRLKGIDYEGNYYPGPDADDYRTTTTGPKPGGTPIVNGWYRFEVPPGIYEVWEELPAGWGTTTLILIPGSDPSDPNNYRPHYWNIVVVDGLGDYSAKFGNYPFIKIWGVKFYDKDYDGEQDWVDTVGGLNDNDKFDPGEETEPGLNGWVIKLWRYDLGSGTYKAYPSVANQKTYITATVGGWKGYYEFVDLPPGRYKVTEVIDLTWWEKVTLDSELEGLEPGFPSDVQQAAPQTLDPVRIGNIQYARIEGVKFWDDWDGPNNDLWPDGVYTPEPDGDDYLLTGWQWTFTLTGTNVSGDPVNWPCTTDTSDARYCFAKLLPGTYTITETVLQDWVPTTHESVTIVIPAIPLSSPIDRVENFGNIAPRCDPELQFSLVAGWNLWSAPISVQGLTAKNLLAKIGPNGFMVVRFDSAKQDYKEYIVGDPDSLNFPIVLGEGYYIWSWNAVSFRLVGDLVPGSDSALAYGWNIVGYNQLKPIMASQFLTMVEGTTAWVIVRLDRTTGEYHEYVSGDPAKYDFWVTPGSAYYLWSEGTGVVSY